VEHYQKTGEMHCCATAPHLGCLLLVPHNRYSRGALKDGGVHHHSSRLPDDLAQGGNGARESRSLWGPAMLAAGMGEVFLHGEAWVEPRNGVGMGSGLEFTPRGPVGTRKIKKKGKPAQQATQPIN